jgi:hypothetical protein
MPLPPEKSRSYGLFVLAALIYTAGVVAFSAWSYYQQRASLLAHIDHSLINATHATEQILGNIFIECAVETETLHELGFAANKAELGRFATACHFDAVGAIAVKGTNRWMLVEGGVHDGIIPVREVLFTDPIQSNHIEQVLRSISTPGNDPLCIQNMHHETYGLLRLAVRYQAISEETGYALAVMLSTDSLQDVLRAEILRKIANGLFLLIMAFPLVALFHRARVRSSKQMAELNTLLYQDLEKQKEREIELKDAIHDLERFNAVAVGRESRIIELKAEINALLKQMNRAIRYNIDKPE